MKLPTYGSIMLAGLLAAGGAQAQSSLTTVPQRAGEASTFVQGRPNMNPDSAIFAANRDGLSRDEVRRELSSSSTVPPRAGQASTFVQGRPNMNPDSAIFAANRGDLSRDQVRHELLMRDDIYRAALEARMGNTLRRDIGVPATLPIGSPSVFEGGTPD